MLRNDDSFCHNCHGLQDSFLCNEICLHKTVPCKGKCHGHSWDCNGVCKEAKDPCMHSNGTQEYRKFPYAEFAWQLKTENGNIRMRTRIFLNDGKRGDVTEMRANGVTLLKLTKDGRKLTLARYSSMMGEVTKEYGDRDHVDIDWFIEKKHDILVIEVPQFNMRIETRISLVVDFGIKKQGSMVFSLILVDDGKSIDQDENALWSQDFVARFNAREGRDIDYSCKSGLSYCPGHGYCIPEMSPCLTEGEEKASWSFDNDTLQPIELSLRSLGFSPNTIAVKCFGSQGQVRFHSAKKEFQHR